jgi:hypothetical protein
VLKAVSPDQRNRYFSNTTENFMGLSSCLAGNANFRGAHKPNCVYLNTLDVPIDFVGRFEYLKEDAGVIRDALRIASAFDVHSHGSKRRKYQYYYEREAQEEVESIYREDIRRWGYSF